MPVLSSMGNDLPLQMCRTARGRPAGGGLEYDPARTGSAAASVHTKVRNFLSSYSLKETVHLRKIRIFLISFK